MTAEFLMAYLLSVNQLNEIRSRVASAGNDQDLRKSLWHLDKATKRCNVLRSLVFPMEA